MWRTDYRAVGMSDEKQWPIDGSVIRTAGVACKEIKNNKNKSVRPYSIS